MPGINLLVYKDNQREILKDFSKTQSSMRHFSNWKDQKILTFPNLCLGYTYYAEYPLRYFETDNYLALVEGMIYNLTKEEVDSFILNICLAERKGSATNTIHDFLMKADGEFVIAIYDKLKQIITIINDALARLPVYYYVDIEKFILSREVKFLCSLMGNVAFDNLGISEYLLFNYTLSERTLIENIKRLKPAAKITFDMQSGKFRVENIDFWNFQEKFSEDHSVEEFSNELAKLFIRATNDRVQQLSGFKTVVSLSGGWDSRAVLAATKLVASELFAVTYFDYDKKAKKDSEVAKELAQLFEAQWELITLEKRRFEDMLTLINLKDGLNIAKMGFILNFFANLKGKFGDKIAYYSGDGGDKALPDLRPLQRINTVDDLVDLIMRDHASKFALENFKGLASVDQVKEEVKDIVSSYPEDDLNQKYVHFVIFERGFNSLFEGEDRNRCYFWSPSPFWSSIVFAYAMKIPDNYKKYRRLQFSFLKNLDSKCLEIEYPAWGSLGKFGRLSFFILPIAESVALKYPTILEIVRRSMNSSGKILYSPSEHITNFDQMMTLISSDRLDFPFNLRKALDEDLTENDFFAVITLLIYAKKALSNSS
jgi:asparagine synthase (glutamine-hydrolysing)